MKVARPKVYVVDTDSSTRVCVGRMIGAGRVDVEMCDSTSEFLEVYQGDRPTCLVMDVQAEGPDILAVLTELEDRGAAVSVVALGANPKVSLVVRSLKAGVLDFIAKPYQPNQLLDSVGVALDRASKRFERGRARDSFASRLDALTKRQRQILAHLVEGKANKAIAYELGISARTVEVHRQRLLGKMSVASAVELAWRVGAYSRVARHDAGSVALAG